MDFFTYVPVAPNLHILTGKYASEKPKNDSESVWLLVVTFTALSERKKNYVHLWSIFILPQTQKINMSSAGREKRVNDTEVKETWVTQGQQAPFCWCGSLLSGSVMRTIGCWLRVPRMPRQWHNLRSDPICFLLSFLPKHSHISMNLFSIAPSF